MSAEETPRHRAPEEEPRGLTALSRLRGLARGCLHHGAAAHNSSHLPWLLLALGALFRAGQYAYNRSLWLDEVKPAVALITRSFSDLARPSPEGLHIAPVGFLWAQKAIVEMLGHSEFVLRLLPFLAGLASLYLFYRVARRMLGAWVVPVALILFACSDRLIYYASELKPYSTDVCVALLLYALLLRAEDDPKSWMRLALLSAVGAVAIWCSHPSVFILAAIALVCMTRELVRKDWKMLARLALAFTPWALSFLVSYYFCLQHVSRKPTLVAFWQKAFLPFPPASLADLRWPLKRFLRILKNPVGLFLSRVGLVAFIAGCISLWYRKRGALFLLITPLLLTIAASALHKYPFSGRVVLFLVPCIILVIAEGAVAVYRKTSRFTPAIGVALALLLVVQPTGHAMCRLVRPRTHEEIRPVLAYLDAHLDKGDVLYLYHGAGAAFQYYRPRYHFEAVERIGGVKSKRDHSRYARDLRQLRGRARVWLLFSHVAERDNVNEEQVFLTHLDKMGTRLDTLKAPGAAVYLYDLRPDQPGK